MFRISCFLRLSHTKVSTRPWSKVCPRRAYYRAPLWFSSQFFSTSPVEFDVPRSVLSRPQLSKRDENRTVYITAFQTRTTEASLKQYFSRFGEIDSLYLARTELGKRPRFALVTYKNESVIETILKRSHGLGGHEIKVERYVGSSPETGSTCIVYVRKFSPETTVEDIVEHFSQYGSVLTVDWPVDSLTKTRKDFCFVQFVREEEAEAASRDRNQVMGMQDIQVEKKSSQKKTKSSDTIILYPAQDATVESVLEHFSKFGNIHSIRCRFFFPDANSPPTPLFWVRFDDPQCVLDIVKQTCVINGEVVPVSRSYTPTKEESTMNIHSCEQKLFIDGLPSSVTEGTVSSYFRMFGKVSSCKIVQDPETYIRHDGCVVTYSSSDSIHKVLKKEKHEIGGRVVRVRRLGWNSPSTLHHA